jgi:hypothetical protein
VSEIHRTDNLALLLKELDTALAEGRPARYVDENGFGVDYSHLPPDEAEWEMRRLREEVVARMEGRETLASRLGEVIRSLRDEGRL